MLPAVQRTRAVAGANAVLGPLGHRSSQRCGVVDRARSKQAHFASSSSPQETAEMTQGHPAAELVLVRSTLFCLRGRE